MKTVKLILLCVIITIVMAVSWAIGTILGNIITGSAPPPSPADPAQAGMTFLAVCAFNAVLIVTALQLTRGFTAGSRRIALVLFVFVVQTLLPQMETFFFASGIGIGYDQTMAIVIAGAVVSVATVMIAILIYDKMLGATTSPQSLHLSVSNRKRVLLLVAVLIFIGYPLLYLSFGYFIAWQNESLRIFYTSSPVMESFSHQLRDLFSTGIYPFQVLRSLIWIGVTVPIVVMLKENSVRQFVFVGILTSLLPTSLLFIPNPYMPWDIAMTHFVETSTSNFLWGLLMVWAIKRGLGV